MDHSTAWLNLHSKSKGSDGPSITTSLQRDSPFYIDMQILKQRLYWMPRFRTCRRKRWMSNSSCFKIFSLRCHHNGYTRAIKSENMNSTLFNIKANFRIYIENHYLWQHEYSTIFSRTLKFYIYKVQSNPFTYSYFSHKCHQIFRLYVTLCRRQQQQESYIQWIQKFSYK